MGATIREEFVKRAAFVLVAVRAVHDKHTDDCVFADLLPTMMAAADDDRHYVRKGASWALRQIGKRSDRLRARVVDTVTPALTATAAESAGSPAMYRASYFGRSVLYEAPSVPRSLESAP